ncbi:hypothetical protein Clacol_006580 [Clathrus columnatus]|uniref:Uncharacterized protein n=1 Tax=Clathrus columnatus TaxID=1419009 RepID=A0AAV5AI31_9AGAM|nr:hypothetical protein Clacol_006580 [Clathrus columnatus]
MDWLDDLDDLEYVPHVQIDHWLTNQSKDSYDSRDTGIQLRPVSALRKFLFHFV